MTDENQALEPAVADDEDTQQLLDDKADAKSESDDETGEAPEAGNDTGAKQKDPAVSGVQKRIDELTREKYDERRRREAVERDLDYLRKESERYRSQQQPVSQPADASIKTLADFAYDDAAYAKYVRDTFAETARKEAREAIKAEAASEASKKQQQQFLSRVREFEKSNPDFRFDDIRSADISISQDMVSVITASDMAPQLLQHLHKNPLVAEQLSQLPVHLVARELGRLEAKFEYEAKAAKSSSVSKAPPPPPKVEGVNPGNTVRTTDDTGDALSVEKWVELERKRLDRKQRR